MTERERNGLLLLLAATAGSVDAWSYFVLAHVFVANMTGSTVLLGFALAQGRWASIVRPLLALGFYGSGVFLGGLLARNIDPHQTWPRGLTLIHSIEAALLLAAACAWAILGLGIPILRFVLVAVCALALGLQSAAMQALNLPGIVTTYITGTWTTLWSGLARFVSGREHTAEERHALRLQGSVLAAYCAAAALAGLVARVSPAFTGAVPGVCIAWVVLAALLAGRRYAPAARPPPLQSSASPAWPLP